MVALTDFTRTLEVAMASTPRTASPSYTDLTPYVMAGEAISLSRGRSSEQDPQAQPGRGNVTLRNTDARFTMGNGSSPYAPLAIRRPCRYRVRYGTASGNFLAAEDASFEGGTTGAWTTTVLGFSAVTLANSAVRAQSGTKSLLITWPTSTAGASAIAVSGLVIGRTYTASAYVYVPIGSPTVTIDVFLIGNGTNTAGTTGSFVRLSKTFVATASSHFVDVQATSTGAGQQAWVDAVQVDEGSAVGTFTTSAPPIYDRWSGFVDEWGNGRLSTTGQARLSMSDRLARASASKFKGALLDEMLIDSPVVLFPMNDESTAGGVTDIVTGYFAPKAATALLPSVSTIVLGSGTAPGPDGGSVATLTNPAETTGRYFGDPFGTAVPASTTTRTIEAMVSGTSMPAVNYLAVAEADIEIGVTGSFGDPRAYACVRGGTAVATGTLDLRDGATHHIAASGSISAGTVTVRLYIDGVQASVQTGAFAAFSGYPMNIGKGQLGGYFTGNVSHVAVYGTALSAGRIADHAAAVRSWAGETTLARFTRLSRVAGLPSSFYATTGTTEKTMGAQPTAGKSLLSALREVAEVENGNCYVDHAGILRLATANTRYNTTVALTLDATKAGHVSTDTAVRTDDALLVNDATASSPSGVGQRTFNQASIDAYDLADTTQTLYTDSDAICLNWTQWRVANFKDPQARCESVTVNVVAYANTGGDVAQLLNADQGTRLRLTNLPADISPTSTLDLLIEGVRDDWPKDTYTITFTTSPIGLNDGVWVLGTSLLGVGTKLGY